MSSWNEVFVQGKVPARRCNHTSFNFKGRFYIFGGQDIKEGAYSDLWSIDMSWITEQALEREEEREDEGWREEKTSGEVP